VFQASISLLLLPDKVTTLLCLCQVDDDSGHRAVVLACSLIAQLNAEATLVCTNDTCCPVDCLVAFLQGTVVCNKFSYSFCWLCGIAVSSHIDSPMRKDILAFS
jgi:hypothetical protein